jgi:serine/threonine protein kinase
MSQDRIEDLLVEWEVARQEGRAVSAADLCADDPDLLAEISERIETLKSTSWMLDDAVDPNEEDINNNGETPDQSANHGMETLAGSEVTVVDFVNSINEHSVLSDAELTRLQQDYLPGQREQLAVGLAQRLIHDGLLTDYQAAVLLKRKDGPLLLDRYVILDVVGSGGMGLVFKALHRSMERIVALKVLPPHASDSPDKIARFEREIKAAAKLSHPNIVAAYDAHEANGACFLVMEYVDGMNLWQHVREHGPFTVEDATRITIQMANALSEAHRQGIIHRDIKPSNILLTQDGNAKLLDLGLARLQQIDQHEGDGSLTRDGLAMGTVAFMSPEQALDSKMADARSDVYSLGCTFYYLLMGRAPFDKDTSVQTIVAHREEEIPSLGDAQKNVPASLNAVFCRMVAKDADDRQQSMKAVHAELLACGVVADAEFHARGPHTITADSVPTMLVRRRRLPRWTIGLSLAGLAVVTLAVIGAMLLSPRSSQRDVAEWIIRAGGMVEVDSEFGSQQFTRGEQLPKEDFDVIGIDLTQASVGSIKSLAALTELQWLSAMDVSFEQQQFRDLAQLKQLVVLQLPSCSIGDEDLKPLAEMRQLESLDLGDNPITDEGLKHISQLSKLTLLYINDTDISDVGALELQRLTALEDLDLSWTNVTGIGIRHLRSLKHLTDLELQGMTISVEDVASLAELKQLSYLVLDACDIADEAMGKLSDLQGLSSLFLDGTNLGDGGLAELVTLQKLEQLDISNTNVTLTGLLELNKLPRLADLWLGGMMLNDESLTAISSLKQLELLDLTGTNIGDDDLRKLVGLRRLILLYVGETGVTEAGANWSAL